MFVTVYDTQTGIIRDCIEVSADFDAPLQAQEGESWVEGYSDPNYHVVSGGQITDKPAEETEAYEIEQAWMLLRQERNAKLKACDWTQVPDAPVDQIAWATYRQQLRDLPENTADPRDVIWPTPPSA